MTEPLELLTVKDLTGLLQCNKATVYRLLKRGELPGFRLGGSWRFRRDVVQQWVDRKTVGVVK